MSYFYFDFNAEGITTVWEIWSNGLYKRFEYVILCGQYV